MFNWAAFITRSIQLAAVGPGGLILALGEQLVLDALTPEPSAQEIAVPTGQYNKAKKSEVDKSIIGLKFPVVTVKSISSGGFAAPTVTTDTSTYFDRALMKISTGGNLALIKGITIRGTPVYKFAGKSGYSWRYSKESDIEINGEKEYKVSNDFITSASQCEDVGDFVRKEIEPHDMYSLTLRGTHPYYKVGDRYTLEITYKLPSMTWESEFMSVDVEIRGVSISRSCTDIGQTVLSVRVPSGVWSKTTTKKAQWIAKGSPLRELSRSNVVTIAAYDSTKQADIYCDGVDDDEQIQWAIDDLSALGGGTVKLLAGSYVIGDTITMKGNITLEGEGEGTVIYPGDNSIQTVIQAYTDTGYRKISRLSIDGDMSNITFVDNVVIISDQNATKVTSCNDVIIKNYKIEEDCTLFGFWGIAGISGCKVKDIYSDEAETGVVQFYGYRECYEMSDCSISSISLTNGAKTISGFYDCERITTSVVENITNEGTIDCFNVCSQITASSAIGFNGASVSGFYGCSRMTLCRSRNGTGSTYYRGIYSCNSVHECSSDSSPTKYTGSYADFGFTYPCADTPNGGFNS